MKIVDVKCLECNKKSEQFVDSDVQYGDTATCEHCSGKAVVVPSATYGKVPGSTTPCTGGVRARDYWDDLEDYADLS